MEHTLQDVVDTFDAALNVKPGDFSEYQQRLDGMVSMFSAAQARSNAERARKRELARAKLAHQEAEKAEFAEMLDAGFTADDLKEDYPYAHMCHLNALFRARQGR